MTNRPIRNLAKPSASEIDVFTCMNNINNNLPYCHGIVIYIFRSASGTLLTRQELSKYEFMLRLVALLKVRDDVLEFAFASEFEVGVDVSALDNILFPIIWALDQACGNAEDRVQTTGNGRKLQIELREEDVDIDHIVAIFAKAAWVVEDSEVERMCLLEEFAGLGEEGVGQFDRDLTVKFLEGVTAMTGRETDDSKDEDQMPEIEMAVR